MSKSRHPIALSLERRVGGDVRLLATVMALPLVDGIFAALVVAGVLDTIGGIVQVGLLVFGGSATLAVVLVEMEADRWERARQIALLGVAIVAVAAIEAALAPTIESLVDLVIFERFAALVILAVAAMTASARVGEYLPRPAVIVGLGLIASVRPAEATLVFTPDSALVLRGAAAAGVGVAFALAVAVLAPTLRAVFDVDSFRFGSAVALGTLPLSIMGLIPQNAPLAVFAVASLLSFDPGGVDESSRHTAADGGREAEDESERDAPEAERVPWM